MGEVGTVTATNRQTMRQRLTLATADTVRNKGEAGGADPAPSLEQSLLPLSWVVSPDQIKTDSTWSPILGGWLCTARKMSRE